MHHPIPWNTVRRGVFASGIVVLLSAAFSLLAVSSALAEDTSTADAPLIVIDPGHGGRYSNANANGLKEKNVNLQVSLLLRDRLVDLGYRVIMTRETDRAVQLGDIPTWNYRSSDGSWHYRRDHVLGYDDLIPEDDLQARADVANRAGADLFICVHANGALSRYARGYETFASRRDALGRSLSTVVQRSVIAQTGLRDRGAQVRDFYVCRWTNMPAILVETAFISNPYDAALLKSPWFRGRIADGIATGVDSWFAVKPYRRLMPRLGGDSPESHAAAIAAVDYPEAASAVVLARADRWSEVPGAVSLAHALGGPLLWIGPSGVTTSTAAELARLGPERVILVGTEQTLASVSTTDVASAASVETSAITVLSATTAASLSATMAASSGAAPRVVFISSTSTPRASLAAAPIAASMDAPLLLASGGALAPESVAFLEANRASIRRIVLVGTPERIPTALAAGIPALRYSASDLPTLAGILNSARFRDRTPDSLRPVVADGRFGAEYLASALHAARTGHPLLPAEGRVLPPTTREWITNHRSVISAFEVHDARRATPLLMDHMLRKADYL